MRLDYFVGSHHIASDSTSYPETTSLPSLAYFCGHCGEIWARRVVSKPVGYSVDWLPLIKDCPKHGAGTLLAKVDIDLFTEGYKQFPLTLLTYEFMRRAIIHDNPTIAAPWD